MAEDKTMTGPLSPIYLTEGLRLRLEKSVKQFNAMSSEEQEALRKCQRDGYIKAEMSWPKVNKKMVDGVLVYASLEDFYND